MSQKKHNTKDDKPNNGYIVDDLKKAQNANNGSLKRQTKR